jgi:hypothetical protein
MRQAGRRRQNSPNVTRVALCVMRASVDQDEAPTRDRDAPQIWGAGAVRHFVA